MFAADLPEVLKVLRTRPLFVTRLDVRPLILVGEPPGAFRRIGTVPHGVFEGERLLGEVMDGGSDWQTVRSDGATTLDAPLSLKAGDGALICMTVGIAHFAEGDHPFRRIAITDFASSRSERSDVSL